MSLPDVPMSLAVMALRYWEEDQAPGLRRDGIDELTLEKMSAKYVFDILQIAGEVTNQLTAIWLTTCDTCRHPRYMHKQERAEAGTTLYRHFSGRCADKFPSSGLKCPCPLYVRYAKDDFRDPR